MMLGAGLRRAAQAAGAGYTAAKAKAEASITPETKAKLEAARSKLEDVGRKAGKAASGEMALGCGECRWNVHCERWSILAP